MHTELNKSRTYVRPARSADRADIRRLAGISITSADPDMSRPDVDRHSEMPVPERADVGQLRVLEAGGRVVAIGGWSIRGGLEDGSAGRADLFMFGQGHGGAEAALVETMVRELETAAAAFGQGSVTAFASYEALPHFQSLGFRPERLATRDLGGGLAVDGVELTRRVETFAVLAA